jgi:anti-sigma factor RsiW
MFRRPSLRSRKDLPCQAFVEAVTDYLEGSMRSRERARFEHHITQCDGCEHYLAQIRETIRLTGRLTTHDIDALGPTARDTLLDGFRSFQAER